MTIHPAVAPSGATGLAGSLMRHRHRLLQDRSLTRRFLSAVRMPERGPSSDSTSVWRLSQPLNPDAISPRHRYSPLSMT
ncbi:hypothetical protein D4764_02G0009330 [Takifugu flavidus]|uniref:Uncharacterized protein n=1 Tax=Takifugu flavidus TaxID=433684 RepID=A0A5C6NJW9_9TELE|nr:hypothetical protein D4764_02G0009330 [Takifugu flavidus]